MPYTYSSLVADIKANLEEDSTEFDAAIPSIIERAQHQFIDYLTFIPPFIFDLSL